MPQIRELTKKFIGSLPYGTPAEIDTIRRHLTILGIFCEAKMGERRMGDFDTLSLRPSMNAWMERVFMEPRPIPGILGATFALESCWCLWQYSGMGGTFPNRGVKQRVTRQVRGVGMRFLIPEGAAMHVSDTVPNGASSTFVTVEIPSGILWSGTLRACHVTSKVLRDNQTLIVGMESDFTIPCAIQANPTADGKSLRISESGIGDWLVDVPIPSRWIVDATKLDDPDIMEPVQRIWQTDDAVKEMSLTL